MRDESVERTNWYVVAVVSVVGVGAVFFGLRLADDKGEAWSGVLIEIGASIGLVAVLAFLERRLVARTARTAETAARTAVQDVADAFEERLVRLEELDDAQAQSREARRKRADAVTDAVRTQGLDATKVGKLLTAAGDREIFSPGDPVRVRTGVALDCPLLYLLALNFKEGNSWLFLDFEPIRIGEPFKGVPMPVPTNTIVQWGDESAGEVAGKLEASLERLNEPVDRFSFQFALGRLVRSVEVMRAAREAPSGSPLRLEGKLRLLVHDEWVLTDWGLESVSTSTRFRGHYGMSYPGVSNGRDGTRFLFSLTVPPDQEATAPGGLEEALAWMRERENVEIKAADDPKGPSALYR
jgi:hypothetical protein